MKQSWENTIEKKIISLLKQRDIKGMDALYDQYSDFVFGLICNTVKFDDLAEIVLQNAFMKVWDTIDSFSAEEGLFGFWLVNIARKEAIDMTKSKIYVQRLKITNFKDALNKKNTAFNLNQIEAKIIKRIYFEGFTDTDKIAEELNLSSCSFKESIRSLFNKLRFNFENGG